VTFICSPLAFIYLPRRAVDADRHKPRPTLCEVVSLRGEIGGSFAYPRGSSCRKSAVYKKKQIGLKT